MGFSYYVLDKDSIRKTLDSDGLLELLKTSNQGEICIDNPSDQNKIQYKILYDVDAAKVELISISGGVTNFYSESSEKDLVNEMCGPISDAITQLVKINLLKAQINLLNQLYGLEDGKICDVITRNFPGMAGQIMFYENSTLADNDKLSIDINKTLAEILDIKYSIKPLTLFGSKSSTQPTTGEIAQRILKEKIGNVNSSKDIDSIISEIAKVNQNAPAKEATFRS